MASYGRILISFNSSPVDHCNTIGLVIDSSKPCKTAFGHRTVTNKGIERTLSKIHPMKLRKGTRSVPILYTNDYKMKQN